MSVIDEMIGELEFEKHDIEMHIFALKEKHDILRKRIHALEQQKELAALGQDTINIHTGKVK